MTNLPNLPTTAELARRDLEQAETEAVLARDGVERDYWRARVGRLADALASALRDERRLSGAPAAPAPEPFTPARLMEAARAAVRAGRVAGAQLLLERGARHAVLVGVEDPVEWAELEGELLALAGMLGLHHPRRNAAVSFLLGDPLPVSLGLPRLAKRLT